MKLLNKTALISLLSLSVAFLAGCPSSSEDAAQDLRAENEELMTKLKEADEKAAEHFDNALKMLEAKQYPAAISNIQEAVKNAPDELKEDLASAQLEVQTESLTAAFADASGEAKESVEKILTALKEGNTEDAMKAAAELQTVAENLTDDQKATLSALLGDAGEMIKGVSEGLGL
ncbi:MAG: hypothetical protein ACFB20_00055 [Opitutales bacterium]